MFEKINAVDLIDAIGQLPPDGKLLVNSIMSMLVIAFVVFFLGRKT